MDDQLSFHRYIHRSPDLCLSSLRKFQLQEHTFNMSPKKSERHGKTISIYIYNTSQKESEPEHLSQQAQQEEPVLKSCLECSVPFFYGFQLHFPMGCPNMLVCQSLSIFIEENFHKPSSYWGTLKGAPMGTLKSWRFVRLPSSSIWRAIPGPMATCEQRKTGRDTSIIILEYIHRIWKLNSEYLGKSMKVQYSIYFRIFVYIMNIYKRILIKKESVS